MTGIHQNVIFLTLFNHLVHSRKNKLPGIQTDNGTCIWPETGYYNNFKRACGTFCVLK